jgi:hypothetical protein
MRRLVWIQRERAARSKPLERDEETLKPVFPPHPALKNLGTNHVHDFGLNQSKIIVI